MSETVERTWMEEMEARIEARVKARIDAYIEGWEARGERRALRDVLCTLLADAFGTVPLALVGAIQVCDDVERLKRAIRRVRHTQSLAQFHV
jgi:hypothetical protein